MAVEYMPQGVKRKALLNEWGFLFVLRSAYAEKRTLDVLMNRLLCFSCAAYWL